MSFKERFGNITVEELAQMTKQMKANTDLSKILQKQRDLEKHKKIKEEIKKMLRGK